MSKRSNGHGSGRYKVRADAPARIRAERERQGLTQTDLGLLMLYPSDNAAQAAVKRVEAGDAAMTVVQNAAGALGLPLEDVIEWASERSA